VQLALPRQEHQVLLLVPMVSLEQVLWASQLPAAVSWRPQLCPELFSFLIEPTRRV
jgi:hypothetical protein